MRNEKGFTMIELVVVIVILGILAAVAVPKYVDMRTEAQRAAANGVYGAAESASAINFAAGLLGTAGYSAISNAADLTSKMDGGTPDGWTADAGGLCIDDAAPAGCTAADTYLITVVAESTGVSKAALTRAGAGTW